MAICTADMKTCKPKKRCLFGPNEGKAYNPADPCCGVGRFDEEACDCGYGPGWERISAYWNVYQLGTGTLSRYTGWLAPNVNNGPLQHSVPIGSGRYGYIDYALFASCRACAGPDSAVQSSGTFQYRVTVSRSDDGPGLEDDFVRDLCVWPRYCGVQRYTGVGTGETGCVTNTTTGRIIASRLEVDEETDTENRVYYRLFDNMDPAAPYHQDEEIDGVPLSELPLYPENTGSVFNSDCLCGDLL